MRHVCAIKNLAVVVLVLMVVNLSNFLPRSRYEYASSEGMLPPVPEDDKDGLNMCGGAGGGGNEWGGGAWNNDDSMVLSPRLMNESSVVSSPSSPSTNNEPSAQLLPGVSASGVTAAMSSKEAPTVDAGVRAAIPASSSPLKQRRCVVPTRTQRSINNVGVRLPRSPRPPNQRPQGGGIEGGIEGRGGGGAVDAVGTAAGAPLFTVPRKRGFPTTNLWRRTNDYRSWEADVPLWK